MGGVRSQKVSVIAGSTVERVDFCTGTEEIWLVGTLACNISPRQASLVLQITDERRKAFTTVLLFFNSFIQG